MSSQDELIEQEREGPQDYNNPLAWGKSKENFYKESESEYSSIGEEEKQVENIYQKHIEALDEDDFMLHKATVEDADVEEEASVDYRKEVALLKKEIKKVLKHSQKVLPLLKVKQLKGLMQHGSMSFLSCSNSINQAYVMAMLMLLDMYQAGELEVNKHPIIDRLAQLRELYLKSKKQYNELEPRLMEALKQQIEEEEEEEESEQVEAPQKPEKPVTSVKKDSKPKNKHLKAIENYLDDKLEEHVPQQNKGFSKAKLQQFDYDGDDFNFAEDGDDQIEEGLENYAQEAEKQRTLRKKIKKQRREQFLQSLPKEKFDKVRENQARSINYTILKNRGLTRRRKNQAKSSRVKLRGKYEKAQIKRRGKGLVHYENPGRAYEGETNIKMGKLTGVKLK